MRDAPLGRGRRSLAAVPASSDRYACALGQPGQGRAGRGVHITNRGAY